MGRSFFCFVTIYAFDRQTDTFLVARPRRHSMQRGKNIPRLAKAATSFLLLKIVIETEKSNVLRDRTGQLGLRLQ